MQLFDCKYLTGNKMKIAIDCRYIGKSGIGRVCEGIIDNLDYDENSYYLIGNPALLKKYEKAVVIEDLTQPYSVKGLLKFNKKRINKECDCIILPNFLIPFGIKIPIHSVMHDLIFLDIKETVNGKIDYLEKKILLKRCMKKSKTIACVSAFTKSRCEYHFKKYSHKCYVNYNGLSQDIIEYGKNHKVSEKSNNIVFVGNVKRHKGLTTLLDAFSKVEDDDIKLKIIGEREGFITGLDLDENAYKNVQFTGRLSNEQLYSEIQKAKFLVLPSVYEGFGLPPLEALYLGTQPIISDIEVFREIYKDLPVIYFEDVNDLTKKLQQHPATINCAEQITKSFSFKKFAANILQHIK
jgi:glycosyltransferase involved in cell wall biosynthesis